MDARPMRTCAKCEERPAVQHRGPARCDECRFDPERDGAYRGATATRVRYAEPDEEGCMEVACWCGEATVRIHASLIGQTTESCRRSRCRPALAA